MVELGSELKEGKTIAESDSGTVSTRFNHDGSLLLTSSLEGSIRIFDPSQDFKLMKTVQDGNQSVFKADFSRDGNNRILYGTLDLHIESAGKEESKSQQFAENSRFIQCQ